MNNFLRILSLKEDDLHRVVLVKGQNEGGINSIYDPQSTEEQYQIFIHSRLPFRTTFSQNYSNFSEARLAAAKLFDNDWELLSWDFKTKRPCEDGGRECGSGECDTCKSIKSY